MADIPEGLDEFLGTQPNSPTSAPPSASDQQQLPPAQASLDEPQGLDEFLAPELKEAKYGTLPQQGLAAVEGLAKGVAGPLAPLAEQAIGIPAEDIRARSEVNPVTSTGSEIAGLVGGAVLGTGLGGALAKVGSAAEAGAGALGIGKIGSAVVKGALENLAYQAQDEVSKLVLNDADQSVDSAIVNMGLASVIGGAFGTVPALWNAAMGSKTAGALKSLANKLGGIEGVIPDAVADHIEKAGIELHPAVKAGLSDDPFLRQAFSALEQSDTSKSGQEFQKNYAQFKKDAGDALITAFGKTPDEVSSLGEISKYDAGKHIGNVLADEYEKQVAPIGKVFDDLKTKFKGVDLPKESIDGISNRISQMAIDEGWTASPSSDIMREVNRVTKELPLQKNLKNLSDYITQVGQNTSSDLMNGPLRRAGQMMIKTMKEAETDIIASKLGVEDGGPAAVEAFNNARKAYAAQSALKDALEDRLHIGASTSGYAKALRQMAQTDGEAVLRRLSGTNDANILEVLGKNFPQSAEALRNYHVNDLLSHASSKAERDFLVNNSALLNKYNKLSPELKNFIAPTQGQVKIRAVEGLLDQLKDANYNFSNTARTADKLLQYAPGSAIGVATGLMTHNPVLGAFAGYMAKLIGKDVPDAVRYAMLKFLGSAQRVDAPAFRSAVELIQHTIKGESAISKASAALFKPAQEVIPANLMPSTADRIKLDKMVAKSKDDPDHLLDSAGSVGYYMPDHAAFLTQSTANAVKYLDSQRPKTDPMSPLDPKRIASDYEKAQYNRVLDIANQPLIVLKHIKDGTITPKDIQTVRTLYPALYQRLATKLTDNMVRAVSKGQSIPYPTRMGLSLFLGQPLDSTMSPIGILSAQPKTQQNQPQTAMQPASNPKRSINALNKLPSMYSTPGQSAERDRINRK